MMNIILGRWTRDELGKMLFEASNIRDIGLRIGFNSGCLLDTPYGESTLIGDMDNEEEFVVNLEKVDCLTLIEYVEAMRRSSTFREFLDNLKRIRYREGNVSFNNRNHFFTDWLVNNADYIEDIAREAGGDRTIILNKRLNEKEDGPFFIRGIKPFQREIGYVPSSAIDETLIDRVKSGDYAGVYSEEAGLDVSHVGVIIKDGDAVKFRHASSLQKYRKVIDQDFKEYFSDKSGMVLFRAKAFA
jgi:hypothetical protein